MSSSGRGASPDGIVRDSGMTNSGSQRGAAASGPAASENMKPYYCACPNCYGKEIIVPVARDGCRKFAVSQDGFKLWVYPQGGVNTYSTVAIKCRHCENVRMYDGQNCYGLTGWHNPDLFYRVHKKGWSCVQCPQNGPR